MDVMAHLSSNSFSHTL
uniref:Uncharacterized protein n=1 Tax=Anguilla anguilla TaxID=7936 RepID=A0A0E9QGW7_ANGAN